MRAMAALMWKEWRQVRWFFFTAALLFFGLPMVEAVQHYKYGHGLRTDMPEGIVLAFGGVLAIFVAVGLTCQDLKRGVGYFWQSRPVKVWQWTLNKYVMGLVVVLGICCGVLLMQWYMGDGGSLARLGEFLTGVLYVHTWTIVIIYSLAYLFGSLIRKAVYATIFSMAAGLLVYFLPVLVPALGAFSVINIMEQWPLQLVKLSELGQGGPWFGSKLRVMKLPWAEDLGLRYNIELLRYALVAVGVGVVSCVLVGTAVKRNWRIRVGQKLMYWSLGVVVLLLLCTFAFQVGSNLECLKKLPVDSVTGVGHAWRTTAMAVVDGDEGVLLLNTWHRGQDKEWFLQRFDLSSEDVLVGEVVSLGKDDHPSIAWGGDERKMVWSVERPEYLYFVEQANFQDANDKSWKLGKLELVTVCLGDGRNGGIIGRLDLLEGLGDSRDSAVPQMYLEGKTLYVALGKEVIVIDTSKPAEPVVSEVLDGRPGYWGEGGGGGEGWRWIRLMPGERKSLEERLEASLKLEAFMKMASEGDVAVHAHRDHFVTYRLTGIDRQFGSGICRLEMTGWRQPTPVERLIDAYPRQVFLRDGFAYVLYEEADFGGMTVYDVRRPETIKKVGHYAAPDEQFAAIAPLPDGNILLCGRSLHVVAPPKAARVN